MRFPKAPALLALLLASPTARAAETPVASPTFGERVDVEVVNVDVVVTDAQGNRVTDLAREEFELRIDGQVVPIEYFSEPKATRWSERREPEPAVPSPPAAPGPTETAPPAPPQSYLIVFIDQSALEVKTSASIVDEIREFVIPQLDGTVAVLVAAYVESLRILGTLSTDVVEVDKALWEAKQLRGRGTILATERNRLENEIRRSMNAPGDAQRRANFLENEKARLQAELRSFGERAIDRQRRSVQALRQWVEALAAIEGRKSVLLATNGIASDPVGYLQSLLDQKLRAAEGGRAPVRTEFSLVDDLQSDEVRLMSEFEAMLAAAQNARVAFYTVSPRTPPVAQFSPEFSGSGGEIAEPSARDLALVEAASSVVRLATATGGASLYVDDALSSRLTRVVDDEAATYSLGFPTGEAAGGKEHRIDVEVKRPGLSTRHRETYRRRTLEDRTAEALAAAISLRAVANPLELGLELGAAVPEGKRGKGAVVPLLVRIPLRGLALVPGGSDLRGRLAARVAIQDASGDVRFGASSPIEVTVATADQPRIATHNWAYRAELRLAPGTNRVAVVVVDELAGVFATTSATIDVPKP